VKSLNHLNFSNITPSTEKLKYFDILINAEGIRFKQPTTTIFPIQAHLPTRIVRKNTLPLELLILKTLSQLAFSGRNTLKYLIRPQSIAGFFLAIAILFHPYIVFAAIALCS
jgi:hypothetical protein